MKKLLLALACLGGLAFITKEKITGTYEGSNGEFYETLLLKDNMGFRYKFYQYKKNEKLVYTVKLNRKAGDTLVLEFNKTDEFVKEKTRYYLLNNKKISSITDAGFSLVKKE